MTLPLSSQLAKVAKAWKYDPIRPAFQMETFLTSLAAHPKLTPNAVRAVQALNDNAAQKKVCLLLLFFLSTFDSPSPTTKVACFFKVDSPSVHARVL